MRFMLRDESKLKILSQWVQVAPGFSSSSTKLRSGEIFVALKGKSVDGHSFLNSALQNGAEFFVVEQGFVVPEFLKGKPVLSVEKTADAHREVARLFRVKNSHLKLMAVGGSVGKTSTKEFLFTLAQMSGLSVFKTEKSQNGELGIPLTLENLGRGFTHGIIEIGIDGPGDMIRHVALVRPQYSVLTNIGEEHLNLLKTIDNVFKEEKILFDETLKNGGLCFGPVNDEYLKSYQGSRGVFLLGEHEKDSCLDPSLYEHLPNQAARQNARLAAFSLLKAGWVSSEQLAKHIPSLQLPDGRGRVRRYGTHLVVEDHYNSNPTSLLMAMEEASKFAQKKGFPLCFVLGDMLDLGDQARESHQKIYEKLKVIPNVDSIFFIGPEMARVSHKLKEDGFVIPHETVVSDANLIDFDFQASQFFTSLSAPHICLVKGSRGMRLERALDAWAKLAPPTEFKS